MTAPPYITAPADIAPPVWIEVEPGALWLPREPLCDARTGLFARLTYQGALDAAAALGGSLATEADILRLHDDAARGIALEIPPVTLPTVAMIRTVYAGAIGSLGWRDAAQRLRVAEMSGLGWAKIHDEIVGARLLAAGWDGSAGDPRVRVGNIGKHWVAGAPAGRAYIFGWWDGHRWIEPMPHHQGQHDRGHHDYGTTTLVRRTVAPC